MSASHPCVSPFTPVCRRRIRTRRTRPQNCGGTLPPAAGPLPASIANQCPRSNQSATGGSRCRASDSVGRRSPHRTTRTALRRTRRIRADRALDSIADRTGARPSSAARSTRSTIPGSEPDPDAVPSPCRSVVRVIDSCRSPVDEKPRASMRRLVGVKWADDHFICPLLSLAAVD